MSRKVHPIFGRTTGPKVRFGEKELIRFLTPAGQAPPSVRGPSMSRKVHPIFGRTTGPKVRADVVSALIAAREQLGFANLQWRPPGGLGHGPKPEDYVQSWRDLRVKIARTRELLAKIDDIAAVVIERYEARDTERAEGIARAVRERHGL